MKSIKNLGHTPAGVSLAADEIIELHATRILLLISTCGIKNRNSKIHSIEGLTKLAKLDFFVRYPSFFNRLSAHLQSSKRVTSDNVESKMIRFHYGPWDKRYYQVLPYLEARGVLTIDKLGSQYVFSLTSLGEDISKILESKAEFKDTVDKMKTVGSVLRSFSGNKLKTLVYDVFRDEVAEKQLEEVIDI